MCDVDADGRLLDAITYNPIPSDERLVTVGEGEQARCYDIVTLLDLPTNPFTRQPWPGHVQERVQQYLREQIFMWSIRTLAPREGEASSV